MATTRTMIENWLRRGQQQGAIYMLVICDTYDWDDYPVFVSNEEDLNQTAQRYNGANMQKVMECYKITDDWQSQLAKPRCWNGWSPNFS